MATGRLVGAIPVFDVPGLLRDLAQLMDVIEAGDLIAGQPAPPRPGQPCRVASGPFEGTVGTFVREAHRDLLLLHVHILGQAVPFEVEAFRVELIEGDAR
jgi:transcription antitermination factor NusG